MDYANSSDLVSAKSGLSGSGALVHFFHEHNCRSKELIDQRLEQIRKAVPATRDQAVLESSIVLTHWVCKIIAVLNQGIADLDERIRPLAKAHPDYPIFDSLPGAGEVVSFR